MTRHNITAPCSCGSAPRSRAPPDLALAGCFRGPQGVFPFKKPVIKLITSDMLSVMHLQTSMGFGAAFTTQSMKLASPPELDEDDSMRAGAFGMSSPSWPSKLWNKVWA